MNEAPAYKRSQLEICVSEIMMRNKNPLERGMLRNHIPFLIKGNYATDLTRATSNAESIESGKSAAVYSRLISGPLSLDKKLTPEDIEKHFKNPPLGEKATILLPEFSIDIAFGGTTENHYGRSRIIIAQTPLAIRAIKETTYQLGEIGHPTGSALGVISYDSHNWDGTNPEDREHAAITFIRNLYEVSKK